LLDAIAHLAIIPLQTDAGSGERLTLEIRSSQPTEPISC
jgi:hypothetical protein